MDRRARAILRLDAGAGATMGLLVLALRAWLADLYGLPLVVVDLVGGANVGYACYSGALAVRAARGRAPGRGAVIALVAANALWAPVCVALAALTWRSVTGFGLAHLALEALFVVWLAALEWRHVLPPRVHAERCGPGSPQ